ncbi:MAG: serpin family protein [Dehalococcoidia bacterium]|nr:serpin family protein [Dehalococcoidia bacterium]
MRRHLLIPAALAAFALTAALLSACGDDEASASELVMSEAPRASADPAAAQGAASALGLFSTDLYAILARTEGNLVFSPYSAAVALAMTRNGATGETLDQMSAVLHADQAGDLDAGLNAIEQALATRPGEYRWFDKTVKLELATANQLWGQRDYPFHDAFLDKLAASYGAGMRLVDYIRATEDARKAINAWVSDQTRERIPELIPEGVLNSDTRLVLTNAIYLNAPWMHRFNKDATAPGPFTRLDGSTVEAQLMRLSEELRFAKGPGYQAVELPYVDGSLSMLVIVPDSGDFADFQSAFSADTLETIVSNLKAAQVKLAFPRFEYRTQASLKDALKEMGMPIAFEPGLADFSAMSPDGKNLFIQDVIHEAFIAVDEDGTEAAAATAVVVGRTSAPQDTVELTVDRPFLYAIRDNETGAILFLGRLTDPS